MNENRRVALIAAGILLVLAVAGYVLLWPQPKPNDPSPTTAEALAPPPASDTPTQAAATPTGEPLPDRYPLPESPADAGTLPALSESDAPFAAALAGLADAASVQATLAAEQRIRRLVATVDNLPRERLAMNDRAFKPVPGAFMVKSRDGRYSLNPANEARYVPLLTLVKTAGPENIAKVYRRFYPLFDKAYRELGIGDRHFNDRLVQVIDHLLATPEVEGEVMLVQPKVFYQFADPALEALSSGQKMMIRMGAVNRAHAKQALRSFRREITGAATPTAPD